MGAIVKSNHRTSKLSKTKISSCYVKWKKISPPRVLIVFMLIIHFFCPSVLCYSSFISARRSLLQNSDFNSFPQLSDKESHNNQNDVEVDEYVGSRRHARSTDSKLQIHGFRIESAENEVEYGEDGVPSVLCETEVLIRIFGVGITNQTIIGFMREPPNINRVCYPPTSAVFHVNSESVTDTTALYKIKLPKGTEHFYMCAKSNDLTAESDQFEHQGEDLWLQIGTYETMLPLWASILVIITCLSFSSLFSGLNLGLMSMDRTELKILKNTGTEKERLFASKIQPVRDRGNYLLCSILLANVLVNSLFTILLDSLTSGLIAVIFSTLAIVIFGEITPQAFCSRHGLSVGAKTIYITRAVMILTYPLSYPTSKALDWCLGEEIGNVYNRERLKELVKVTTGINDLDKNEVNIISGALELRRKTVGEVMTHIEDAFMLSLDSILDFETVSDIMKSGFSRIPVYEGHPKNIVTLLYIKDLAFVDTDDNTPLKTLCEFYQNPCHFVFEDVTLDIMFNQFKEGNKGHMAFVHRVNNEGEGDPFYETIGLLTLEDVIEELIQSEIIDETDVFVDNRTKIRRQRNKKQDFSVFAERKEHQAIRISPQLILATFQYLSTAVDAFKKDTISESILRRLLNQDIIHHIKSKGKEKDDPCLIIFQQGKPVDFFVLILEGRVEVTVGKENLLFESGPFTYFGTQALLQNIVLDSPNQAPNQIKGSLQSLNVDSVLRQTFVPDYSVRAVGDVTYIAVKRSLYLTAKRATLLEKSRKSGVENEGEAIDAEVEKLLHSLNEDEQLPRANPKKSILLQSGSTTRSPSLNEPTLSEKLCSTTNNTKARSNAASPEAADKSGKEIGNNHTIAEPQNDVDSVENNSIVTAPLLPKTLEVFK
ncbi:unextended protein [Eupeodes corollae]|uniref:unextended protein n=1 Tax=Eupeodes corollae TaxID=290404 RepID=UPI002493AAFC|nr:unextended protein [Eupeodes corollae]